jgi:hypothetical protein
VKVADALIVKAANYSHEGVAHLRVNYPAPEKRHRGIARLLLTMGYRGRTGIQRGGQKWDVQRWGLPHHVSCQRCKISRGQRGPFGVRSSAPQDLDAQPAG